MSQKPPRPTPEQLARYATHFNASASLRFFNVHVEFPEEQERVRVVLDVKPEHRGGLGTDAVNGGVLAAMFDLAIGCTPALIDPARRTATMQLSMSFQQPVLGARVVAEAWIDRAGASTVFSSAELRDEKGEVCARCQGLARISSIPWASGESPAIN